MKDWWKHIQMRGHPPLVGDTAGHKQQTCGEHILSVDDGSYATPESGAEALRCTRCGYSWSHIYY